MKSGSRFDKTSPGRSSDDRENLDKSGKNPKYMLSFVVKTDAVDAPAEATLPAELAIRIKDVELAALASVAPREGDRVKLRARAHGPRPTSFYLTAVELL